MLRRLALPFALVLFAAATARASGASHGDPSAPVALALAIILLAAKLGGEVAVRLGQASVLGELLAGVLLGNLPLVGFHQLDAYSIDPQIDLIARLGVLLLLFEVGLESTVSQMRAVGLVSTLVALVGVAVPFALGWGVGLWLLPGASAYTHAFVGATLTATSVGITARVLKDLGQMHRAESRIILGAAVIDDVLGLVILAVVTGAVGAAASGTALSFLAIAGTLGKAVGFLVVAIGVGLWLSPKLFAAGARLRVRGVLLALGLSLCFLLSWAADAIGLAPIVGAFAAGLVLEELHTRAFVERGEHDLGDLLHPISAFLVPVFFVVMGMRTDLRAFAQLPVLGIALALVAVAIVGKLACALVVRSPGLSPLLVGLGMIPRGEVGLIFANIGRSLMFDGRQILSDELFSAMVVMVVLTTMATPPLLKWATARAQVAPPAV